MRASGALPVAVRYGMTAAETTEMLRLMTKVAKRIGAIVRSEPQ